MPDSKLVVVTRAAEDSAHLKLLLEQSGAHVYELPTVRFEALPVREADLGELSTYTHVVFTSSHAVQFFTKALDIPPHAEVVAIGTATQAALASQGTASKLFSEALNWSSANVLLPRSQLATGDLPQDLRSRGAAVIEATTYLTLYVDERDARFETLLADEHIGCLTFTSPSSIVGFGHRLAGTKLFEQALTVPVACIGKSTAQAAAQAGFKNILLSKENSGASLVEAAMQTLVKN